MSSTPKNWSEVITQRARGKISELWQNGDPKALKKILGAPSDLGVRLNAGRPGSRFAPQAISSTLKKMTVPQNWQENSIYYDEFRASSQNLSLEEQQVEQALFLKELIDTEKEYKVVHLGGGHDHILPLMQALSTKEGLCVVNIDAHLDTRIDPFSHSGTPFREFSQKTSHPFHLIQVGIHPYSNPKENYTPLPYGQMDIWEKNKKDELVSWIDKTHKEGPCSKAPILLSLDSDGLDASVMEAVSAVNYDGLSLEEVKRIIAWYKRLRVKQSSFGIYEYNPMYDNLSQKGARALSALIYEFWN